MKPNGSKNGNGNGNGATPPPTENGAGDTEREFTEAQRRSFKVLEFQKSIRAGVRGLIELKVVTKRTFYDRWWKQPKYRAEVERRREAWFEGLVSDARQVLKLSVQDAAHKLHELLEAEHEHTQLRAAEGILAANKIDIGKGAKVSVHASVSVELAQAEFKQRVLDRHSSRFSTR